MCKNISVVLSAPTSVDLTMTQQCNHKCIHCYNTWRTDEELDMPRKSLTDAEIRVITDELVKNNVWRATITGGEPLIDVNVMFKLISSFKKAGIIPGLNTNLSLMTKDVAEKMTNEYAWDTIVLTSLPGLTENTCDSITQIKGSYKNILRGISVCNDYGIPVGINIVVSKNNIGDLNQIKTFVMENMISYVSITRAIAPLYDVNNPNYYLDEKDIVKMADYLMEIHNDLGVSVGSVTPFPICILKNVGKYKPVVSATCAAGISRCSINAITGEVSACTHEDTSYGDIYKDGLKKSWDNMSLWRQGCNLNKECIGCRMLPVCGGECRMISGQEKNKNYLINKEAPMIYEPILDKRDISDDTLFNVNKKVKIRKEPFGAAIRCDINECYVSNNIVLLYEILKEKNVLKVSDLYEFCEKNENFFDTVLAMEKIGVLQRVP